MNLLLKNCRLIDESIVNIYIENDTIVKIEGELTSEDLQKKYQVVDIKNSYVSSGWIDGHTHTCSFFKPYSSEPDQCGYTTGVTTVVDAGSNGIDSIEEFYKDSKKYKTRVLAFLNISKVGLSRIDELSVIEDIDFSGISNIINKYPDFILGLKARISKSIVKDNGIFPLLMATDFCRKNKLKLMVHIGNGPPSVSDILNLLGKDTILAHYLNGKSNSIIEKGKVIREFFTAMDRGMELDVAHGNASFSFETAKVAKSENIPLGMISTDIYDHNRLNGPVYSLSHVMSKFLYLGYSLKEVVDAVTINPARILGLQNFSGIKVGNISDLTIFDVIEKDIDFSDSEGVSLRFNKVIKAKGVVLKGEYISIE